jgi:predicted nucleic acid-binding protein
MIILPRHLKQYYLDALKDFNLKSNARPYEMIKNVRFRESFMVYCTPDANVKRFLSEDMQKLLLKYRDTTGKDMHVSFIDANIYIAVAQQKDILEPVLWQSNVSFDLIQEFHSDLIMLMKIVRDFDECN